MINIGDGLSRHFPFRSLDLNINILAQPKEIKNASECIVELLNTREVHREARGATECFSHLSTVLKNSQVLI